MKTNIHSKYLNMTKSTTIATKIDLCVILPDQNGKDHTLVFYGLFVRTNDVKAVLVLLFSLFSTKKKNKFRTNNKNNLLSMTFMVFGFEYLDELNKYS